MRKFFFLFLIAECSLLTAFSQYWQQQVNFTIDVTLNDKDNSLDAFEKIEYINNSPDTLDFIWFHLWPNAYKNDRTAFTSQSLLNGDTRFYFSNKEERGYINRLDFKAGNITCKTEDHPLYIDLVKLILPSPLLPGQTINLSTPFHEQLPHNFSRGGHEGESFQVTQWFPKPAVYDRKGWHPMPYLEQGEYYSEFGKFDVRITVPKNYVVAATGELQNSEERNWLLTRNNFSWVAVKKLTRSKGGIVKKTIQKFPPSASDTKTLQFVQDSVHDFAWFADKRFIVNHDSVQLASGKVVDVFSYYTPGEKTIWKESARFAKQAVKFYSEEVGEYPYKTVSVVQGPESFGGGMEYPMITVISPTSLARELDITIAHEIGHNWFQGVLASNERDHPWMDEGINSFYEDRYMAAHYKEMPGQERTFFETLARERTDQPIGTSSEKFSEANYGLVAYYKTSEWLRWIEQQVGSKRFDESMQAYFRQWQFRHPKPSDFKEVMEKSSGSNLDSAFGYLDKTGSLPNLQRTGTEVITALRPDYLGNLLGNHFQNLISFGPALGVNSYDKLMAGIFITNVKLPPNHFNFFLAPMYATGTKKFTGIGKLDYAIYPNRLFRKLDIFLNSSVFDDNEFADTSGNKINFGFQKIVPGARFTFRQKDLRQHFSSYIQWKSFFISEDGLSFSRDTLVNPAVTRVSKSREHSTLNQLIFSLENSRALYPYKAEFKIEQAKDFARAAFTANYFFNYPRNGGLDLRLFAGKFFYTGSKTLDKEFSTERYHLNLSGANGFEDYTFSDYFIGRNKFQHLPSQQIMVRDGGFKLKTDLLASPVGESDNWLVAVNLASTIPNGVNPLSILPVKIPLKVFFDLGTYADAWKKGAEGDHFLFDGGFQLSLLKNTVNIYIPLIYSDVYKSYIQTVLEQKNRFFRKISFSIDVGSFNLKKIDRDIPF